MIYEHRTYHIMPGKGPEFIRRFGEVVIPLLEKHGGEIVGVWTTAIGPGPEVIYIMAFDDLAERQKYWDAVYQDDEFKRYRPTAEVATFDIKILQPTSYSRLK